MSFSRRMGFEEEPILQKNSISLKLSNRLRNILYQLLDEYGRKYNFLGRGKKQKTNYISDSLVKQFSDNFGIIINTIPTFFDKFTSSLLTEYGKRNRNQKYDFIEFVYNFLVNENDSSRNSFYPKRIGSVLFLNEINRILKEENSAYILLESGEIIPITDEEEIRSIQETFHIPYDNVKIHIKTAIHHFKEEPKDYRNSIKESISAVEAICCELVGDSKATLGEALKKLRDSGIEIHPALEKGFSSIYGYTCDESGIRHNLDADSTEATFDDAKYMLVSCSAFINYLIGKSNGITQE